MPLSGLQSKHTIAESKVANEISLNALKMIIERIIIHAMSIYTSFFDDYKLIKIHDENRSPSTIFVRVKKDKHNTYDIYTVQPSIIETYDIIMDYSKRTLEYPKDGIVINL